jgi:hypothetical protein
MERSWFHPGSSATVRRQPRLEFRHSPKELFDHGHEGVRRACQAALISEPNISVIVRKSPYSPLRHLYREWNIDARRLKEPSVKRREFQPMAEPGPIVSECPKGDFENLSEYVRRETNDERWRQLMEKDSYRLVNGL